MRKPLYVVKIACVELEDEIAAALNPGKGTDSILIESIRLADGSIYCRDFLSAALLDKIDLDSVKIHRHSINPSLIFSHTQEARVVVSYASLILTSEAADETASQRLRVKLRTPLLCLSGIAYVSERRPLYHNTSYFITDRYKFTLVRRRPLIRRPTLDTVFAG